MKKLYFFFLLPLLLAASCKKEKTSPADKLLPATMTGANTFGCLVNGEPWLPHSGSLWDPSLNVAHGQFPTGEWQLKIGATKDDVKGGGSGDDQAFSINVWDPVVGDNLVQAVFWDFDGCGIYRLDSLSPNNMNITKLDDVNFIASGTFYFILINKECNDTIRVTEGRFDADSHL